MNRFAAALSTEAATETAIAQVCSDATRQMDGVRPSFAVLFVSHEHAAVYAEMGR